MASSWGRGWRTGPERGNPTATERLPATPRRGDMRAHRVNEREGPRRRAVGGARRARLRRRYFDDARAAAAAAGCWPAAFFFAARSSSQIVIGAAMNQVE